MKRSFRPTSRQKLQFAAFGMLLALAVGPSALAAGDAAPVVVASGEGVVVTASELGARFASVPSYQYPMFADGPSSSPQAALRGFLLEVVLADTLFSKAAVDAKLESSLRVRFDLARARANALLRSLHPTEGPSDADIAAWYEAHRIEFDTPERISVLRILVATKAEAVALTKQLHDGGGKLAAWNDLAREKSLDKGSNLRGGQLGFLFPDGKSTDAGVVVDRVIYAAAAKLADGEIAKEPIAEGDKFAIVWRHGSIPAQKRSLEDAKAQIRTVMSRERDAQAKATLIKELREKYVTDFHPEKVALIDIVQPISFATKPVASGAIPIPERK